MRFGVIINMDEGFSRGLSSGGALFAVFAVILALFSGLSAALSGADYVELGLLTAFCALPFIHAIWSTLQFAGERRFFKTEVAPASPETPVPLGRSRVRQDRHPMVYLVIRTVLNVVISGLFFLGLGVCVGAITLWLLVLDGRLETEATVLLALGAGPILSLLILAVMVWATRGTWRIKLGLVAVFSLVVALLFAGNSQSGIYNEMVRGVIAGPDLRSG